MTNPTRRLTGYTPSVTVRICGRTWTLERAADLETLWQAMSEADLDDDERLPYWTELWPSSIALAEQIHAARHELNGRVCLDMGCGLGLTALAGAWAGARVIGMDYEEQALRFARRNVRLNGIPHEAAPLWTVMDWRHPAIRRRSIDMVWGGDIMYEKRFVGPVLDCIDHVLSPHGRAWLAEPGRSVYKFFQTALQERGWRSRLLADRPTPALYEQTCPVPVRLWELTRDASGAGRAR
ncbi:Methyltransferase-16 [Oleidesulfovibrio alaskensis G20]|jgi:predicted nicotinamide N-methyase|uniref:Methyltransferase-16 n=1 Tax=Oleidesulfovibrio alaskensis (strain ATCC BAA-1058 / DSM 17464 / G20) TaxID=207559 RepID=Q30X47_OLEA2|nr:methyltransferase domain-containing protein [Oleidesulfovibrio alaskensis]ABB39749.1 Methyltransferase-16 [Oleidesulfovibrio alaskensis G20]MBG0774361.1 methyltransferase domain-containing protein [Oleidesulfovibrio alaskensis]